MLKVLVAEDNIILADILEMSLLSGGYDVCGVAFTVAEAVALADLHKPDVAIFDFRLADGGYGSQIRPLMQPNGNAMGILYVSADDLTNTLTNTDGHACMQKPYSMDDLFIAVRIVNSIKTGSKKCPVLAPHNFHLLGSSVDVAGEAA